MNLHDRHAQAAFARIACSEAERATGGRAEAHRLAAVAVARRLGIPVRAGSPARGFGWDGRRLRAGTEAYVLLHEIAHWQLADRRRRRAREFGLGPGPETGHRAAAERATLLIGLAREREEALASLLGILWEADLRQPALASFLDQNWLEGADRPGAAAHFETTLARLIDCGLVDVEGRPVIHMNKTPRRKDAKRA
ncbi:MAG TPA: hypothetical protein VH020_05035 [Stellaceae bacterium]|nr:hypothetical protein [Stellaceae bacterium]